jgi:hypothetical protein
MLIIINLVGSARVRPRPWEVALTDDDLVAGLNILEEHPAERHAHRREARDYVRSPVQRQALTYT